MGRRRRLARKDRFGQCADCDDDKACDDWCAHACVCWPMCPCILFAGLVYLAGLKSYAKANEHLVLRRLKKKQDLRPQDICRACWARLFALGGDLEGPEPGALDTWLEWPGNAFGTLGESEERGAHCTCCRIIADVLHNAAPGDAIEIHAGDSALWVTAGKIRRPLYLVSPFNTSSEGSETNESRDDGSEERERGGGRGDVRIYNTVNQLIDWDWARTWLDTCQDEHGKSCSSALEKLWPERPDIRLIDVEDMTLLWPAPADSQYAVLSYVWGGAPKMRFENTERGVIDLQQIYKSFPRTIRHAIIATRKMRLRYLWVDSICIQSRVARQGVDDMVDDRLRDEDEVSQFADMHKIYGMASICIVAAQGDSAESGLPGVSEQSEHSEAAQGGYELNSARPGFIGQLRTSRPIDGEIFLAQSLPLPGRVNRSKWASRAWCLQEQLLSRRYLIFHDNQVYFQCNKDMYFEDMPLSHKEEMLQHDKKKGEEPAPLDCRIEKVSINLASDCPCTEYNASKRVVVRSAGFEQYENIVSLYSRRDLSFDSDALRAVDGLLSIFRQTMATDMLSGLPERMLDAALLWRGTEALTRRSQDPHHPRDYLPSWSWAGWRGRVSYEPFQEYDVKERAMKTRTRPSDGKRLPWKNLRPFLVWFRSEESQNRDPSIGEVGESALVPVNGTGAGVHAGGGEGRPEEWRAAWSEQAFDGPKFSDPSLHRALHPHHLHCWTMQARNFKLRTQRTADFAYSRLTSWITDTRGQNIGELLSDTNTHFVAPGDEQAEDDDHDDDDFQALIVISEAHHFWDKSLNEEFAIHNWPDRYDVYNVLLVRVRGEVATREGIGRVSKRGWGSLDPEWKFVRLA